MAGVATLKAKVFGFYVATIIPQPCAGDILPNRSSVWMDVRPF